jgi:hypothetical protein
MTVSSCPTATALRSQVSFDFSLFGGNPPGLRPVPKTFRLNQNGDYPHLTAQEVAERLHPPEALSHEDLSIGSKGLADYGDNTKAVLFLKEEDRFWRFDRTQEAPSVIG